MHEKKSPPHAPRFSGRAPARPLSAEPGGWRAVFRPVLFSTLNRAYFRDGFARDLMAGVIVGVVALPLAIAFAVASGVGPDKGLATAIVAGFLISLLGGSRVQIGGPTGAFIVIVAGIVSQHGVGGLAAATLMAGVLLVAFGLLRLGNVLKFIPHPVIVGFTGGIAVTIFSTQIKDALGLDFPEKTDGFLQQWAACLRHLGDANPVAVGMTAATVALLALARRGFGKVPASLVALLAATVATAMFKLPVATIDTVSQRFGEMPKGLSFAVPDIDWSRWTEYVKPAFTIALLGAVESLLSAVVADGMTGGRHRSNTELVAQGIANIASPFFGGIPATGAIARTATNVKNGGHTPVAGMVHALTLLAILLALGDYAKMIPMPCLAGILIVVAYNMSEWRSFAAIMRASRSEIAVLLTTFALTVLVDLTVAIEIGMVMAAFLFVQRMSERSTVFSATTTGDDASATPEEEIPEDYRQLPAGLDVFEISGPFFFAAARQYQEVLQNIGKDSRVAIIRMRHVPFVDTTGMRNFADAIRFMQARGRTVLLSGVRPSVLRDLKKHGVAALVGADHIYPVFDRAVNAARALLDTPDESTPPAS